MLRYIESYQLRELRKTDFSFQRMKVESIDFCILNVYTNPINAIDQKRLSCMYMLAVMGSMSLKKFIETTR